MPMTGPALSAALKPVIQAQLVAQFGPATDAALLAKYAQAMADAIGTTVVTYIQGNATVVGVTPGGGTATIT